MRTVVATAIATAIGLLLAYYDSRTDDTGAEVGLILTAALVVAAIFPEEWWRVAVGVGLPIPVWEAVSLHAFPGGLAALAISVGGALAGAAVRRASTRTA